MQIAPTDTGLEGPSSSLWSQACELADSPTRPFQGSVNRLMRHAPAVLQCELLDPSVEEQDDHGYLYRRLGEITFGTARQSQPSPPGIQQCVVAAGTFGLVAFADSEGKLPDGGCLAIRLKRESHS